MTPFAGDAVDVGKHLRPNWRGGRVVLLVEPADDAGIAMARDEAEMGESDMERTGCAITGRGFS